MKIILASESFPPNISGVATATKNLAENLTHAGHKVTVFTPGNVLSTRKDSRFREYDVYRVRSIVNPFRSGYRVTLVNPVAIEKRIDEIKPDLIHLQDPANIGKILRDIGRKKEIPVIITNHFSLEYALSYVKFLKLANPLLREGLIRYLVDFYNKCDQVVTPTETFRRQIEDWGVKTPVCAVSNGIEIDDFIRSWSAEDLKKTRLCFHLPENPLVLYLGRVDKDKSIDVLVKAIPLVLAKTDAHFVIAGSGGEVERLQDLVSELKVTNNVTFLGFIDHSSPNFPRLYKLAKIFAIPSTIETQSIVTLEALSSGLPVVAARAGALPELVKSGINGFLFKPGRYDDLAKHLIYILNNKNKSQKMGRESVKIAMGHEMNKAFSEMIELYKKVIKDKKNTKKALGGEIWSLKQSG